MPGQITDLPNTPWRDAILPASFRGAMFHVEAGGRECGRRIVMHEFPKKELPYAEDMGRRTIEFTVRGYCIVYPRNTGVDLYKRDYRIARDALIHELDTEGSGVLQLPTFAPMTVVCQRYRVTEEERLGGYCVFDMSFVEYGVSPFRPAISTRDALVDSSQQLRDRVATVMGNSP